MMLTPAGRKKNAILASRKSAFSWMCSTLSRPEASRSSSRIMPMTLAGKGKGSAASMSWLTQHTAKTTPI